MGTPAIVTACNTQVTVIGELAIVIACNNGGIMVGAPAFGTADNIHVPTITGGDEEHENMTTIEPGMAEELFFDIREMNKKNDHDGIAALCAQRKLMGGSGKCLTKTLGTVLLLDFSLMTHVMLISNEHCVEETCAFYKEHSTSLKALLQHYQTIVGAVNTNGSPLLQNSIAADMRTTLNSFLYEVYNEVTATFNINKSMVLLIRDKEPNLV